MKQETKDFVKQLFETYKFIFDVSVYRTHIKLIFIFGGEIWFTSKEEVINYCERCKKVLEGLK